MLNPEKERDVRFPFISKNKGTVIREVNPVQPKIIQGEKKLVEPRCESTEFGLELTSKTSPNSGDPSKMINYVPFVFKMKEKKERK